MPCILKVRIISARNLPIMDRTTELTDAFVEIKFADLDSLRTPICRKSLNPVWNEDFRFEVLEDSDLQNEPLEIKILDYDQLTYNESIGSVLIDLNPLLAWDSNGQISGWLPIYDSLFGIRGELNVQVKIQFFGNINPFKDSSAGVQFFSSPIIPPGYQIVSLLGFVSALQNEDDPEYHWVDSFRTPRKSNEARTRVMFRLSGGRMLGKKVLDLGGNAVLGFKQYFDLEAEKKSITVRSIGTAVKLVQINQPTVVNQLSAYSPAVGGPPSLAPASPGPMNGTENSNNYDGQEKGDAVEDDLSLPAPALPPAVAHPLRPQDPIFLTMNQFPAHCILSTGGFVCAASIKLLDNDERDLRESWWAEVRDEIKSHARTVGCSYVVGYLETTSISEEVVFLYCSGTAVNLDVSILQISSASLRSTDDLLSKVQSPLVHTPHAPPHHWGSIVHQGSNLQYQMSNSALDDNNSSPQKPIDPGGAMFGEPQDMRRKKKRQIDCQSCHISYSRHESPFPMALTRCGGCRKKFVPEVLLTTIEPPPELKLVGNWVLIEAHVCRQKKNKVGESRATIVSESIPFAQYDIHRQLMYKLRIYGLNAVFGLKIQISIGENLLTAVATGTAVYVKALPTPPALKVFRTLDVIDDEDKQLLETQRKLMQKSEMNRKNIEECLLLDEPAHEAVQEVTFEDGSDSSESSDEEQPMATPIGQSRLQQRAMIVEIDDEQDEDLVLFLDDVWNENFLMCNVEMPEARNSSINSMTHFQMVKMVKQSTIDGSHHPNRQLAKIFKSMYMELANQVSFFSSCSITGISYTVDIPKDTIVQVYLTAMVHGKIGGGDLELLNFDLDPRPESMEDLYQAAVPPTGLGDISSATESKPPRSSQILNGNSTNQMDNLNINDDDEEEDYAESNNEDDLASITDEVAGRESASVAPRSVVDGSGGMMRTTITRDGAPPVTIDLSQLSYIPKAIHKRFLGRICHHFIKESNLVFDTSLGNSGMGGFSHVFMIEMLAIVKSHVHCLGGNAVVSFQVDQIHFSESIKNQGYALLSISGDVWETVSEEPSVTR